MLAAGASSRGPSDRPTAQSIVDLQHKHLHSARSASAVPTIARMRHLPMDENPCAVLATDATAINKSIDLNSMVGVVDYRPRAFVDCVIVLPHSSQDNKRARGRLVG